jgi:hypothetical protein
MKIMNMEIVEVTVKCRVPLDEVEEHILKLRRGEERLPVPAGLTCRDAFECYEYSNSDSAIIRAGYQ